jgi:hypothetical protein
MRSSHRRRYAAVRKSGAHHQNNHGRREGSFKLVISTTANHGRKRLESFEG